MRRGRSVPPLRVPVVEAPVARLVVGRGLVLVALGLGVLLVVVSLVWRLAEGAGWQPTSQQVDRVWWGLLAAGVLFVSLDEAAGAHDPLRVAARAAARTTPTTASTVAAPATGSGREHAAAEPVEQHEPQPR